MKGHVYRRGRRWSYLFNIEPDPLTGDLDRPRPCLRVGVDDLDHPQRQGSGLVVGLDELLPGRGVEIPYRLERASRVRPGGWPAA